MKKGQVYKGLVEHIEFPNKGIVNVDGASCVVKNALPGQTVSFCVNKVRKGKAEGRLLEVLMESPLEVGESCSHFGVCGGCTYISMPYEEQLTIKEAQVKQILDGVLRKQDKPYIWEGIRRSPREYGYRNKMEFTFGDEVKGGPLALGMHKRGSFYDIVTVNDCRIVDADYRQILQAVVAFFQNKPVSFFHRMTHIGYLRHLLVRKASKTGDILIALVTSTQIDKTVEDTILSEFKDMLCALSLEGTIKGILHIVNDSVADVVKSDETRVLYGQEFFYEELLGLKFEISTFSFFQTNSYGAEVLYETAREYIQGALQKDSTVFDLYSGTGTIAQLMAPVVHKVIGVEIIEEAVEAAKKNAERNGLTNCRFIAGDVLKILDEIEEKPDVIILDPPRDGIHPKAIQKIIAYGVEYILYISCKPTSLARDLDIFLEKGYQVERATCVDQFPWTANVETVCLLSKLHEAKYHVSVNLDMDEMDLTSAESKATYEEIKEYVLEKHGLQVTNLYIAQVKRKCGIIERENYNKPKSDDAKQPQCPEDKEKAIMDALKFFRMI